MSAALTIPAGTGLCHLSAPFPLERGGVLDAAHIAYECYGDESRPIVFALGGISAHRHIAASATDPRPGWWEDFVGPGRALDTRRWRVVGIDWLGGRGASSGPDVDERPDAFPTIATGDQAAALALLLDHLGADRAHAIVGSSYGGMVALAFAARFGERADRLIALGAADRAHPYATAFRAVQRRVVRLGQETGRTSDAVALARALAVATYRSAAEFGERFDGPAERKGGSFRFPVEGYLDHHGRQFAATFPPESFLRLSESIDLHHVDAGAIRTPTTLIAFDGDAIAPPEQIAALAHAIGAPCTLHRVASRYGHDAFLKEVDALTPLIREALHVEVAR
jgi:homoserine O-acetyltransferase